METETVEIEQTEQSSEDIKMGAIEALEDADAGFVVALRVEGDGLAVAVAKFMGDDVDEEVRFPLTLALAETVNEHGPGPMPDALAAILGGLGNGPVGDGAEASGDFDGMYA